MITPYNIMINMKKTKILFGIGAVVLLVMLGASSIVSAFGCTPEKNNYKIPDIEESESEIQLYPKLGWYRTQEDQFCFWVYYGDEWVGILYYTHMNGLGPGGIWVPMWIPHTPFNIDPSPDIPLDLDEFTTRLK